MEQIWAMWQRGHAQNQAPTNEGFNLYKNRYLSGIAKSGKFLSSKEKESHNKEKEIQNAIIIYLFTFMPFQAWQTWNSW